MIFGANKMVDEKTNLDKNISTNKTYVKLKDDQQENTSEDINGLEIDESATEPDYVLLNKIDQGDWEQRIFNQFRFINMISFIGNYVMIINYWLGTSGILRL